MDESCIRVVFRSLTRYAVLFFFVAMGSRSSGELPGSKREHSSHVDDVKNALSYERWGVDVAETLPHFCLAGVPVTKDLSEKFEICRYFRKKY